MVVSIMAKSGSDDQVGSRRASRAADLGPVERASLAVDVVAGRDSITGLAERHQVSRKFIYQQGAKATAAIEQAFMPPKDDRDVLFHLPVTKQWIHQLVLALALNCHAPMRGIVELLRDVFDYSISLGTVCNIIHGAVELARQINNEQDLSSIRVGAHDEIFQAGRPVLAGVDPSSLYCYLLTQAEHRDETTWGVHLLDLSAQGLRPDRTIADGGLGLRAGQAAAWPDIPCHADVFHAEMDMGKLVTYLENRAIACTKAREKLELRMGRRKRKGQGHRLSAQLGHARQAERKAVDMANDTRVLAQWMREDILSMAGPDLRTRRALFTFVIEQLEEREPQCAHRIGPVRRMLENHRDNLLGFAEVLDGRLETLARELNVPCWLVHAVNEWTGLDAGTDAYWDRRSELCRKLADKFHLVEPAVRAIQAQTPRASSVVENFNSRLRSYFFLRRHIGDAYLDLLRFFLNHRRFPRSQCPDRVGKSPAELLSGQPHPHWLELLGYQRFQRN